MARADLQMNGFHASNGHGFIDPDSPAINRIASNSNSNGAGNGRYPLGSYFSSNLHPMNGQIPSTSFTAIGTPAPVRIDPSNNGYNLKPVEIRVGSLNDEFFDAAEDSLSEGGSDEDSVRFHSYVKSPSVHLEIMNRLHEERTQRLAAEDRLKAEKEKYEQLRLAMSQISASLPGGAVSEKSQSETNESSVPGSDHEIEAEEEASLVVARTVAEAIAKGVASAIAEEALEQSLAQKEQEISRLKDKLQFWEKMNLELSNQAQENIEIQRNRRKRHLILQQVAFAGAGIVLGIGLSMAVAYFCYPWHSESSESQPPADSLEVSLDS